MIKLTDILKEIATNEALGVPTNILDTAKQVYDDILASNFKFIEGSQDDINSNSKGYTQISGDYKIGEDTYDTIKYFILVEFDPEAEDIVLQSMSVQSSFETRRGKKDVEIKAITNDEISLIFDFICPDTFDTQQTNEAIKQFLIDNKSEITASITHELKHVFDRSKKKDVNLPQLAKYQTVVKFIGDRIRPIHDFCFALYYMSVIETLVRPSEVASLIQSGEITKKEFLNFLKSNETYKMLNNIKNRSYEKLRHDLLGYMDYILDVLDDEPEAIKGKTDEEIVDIFLTRIRKFLQTGSINFIENIIFGTSLPNNIPLKLLQMIGIGSEAEFDFLKKTAKSILKTDDNRSFYRTEIRNNARKADIIMRKLAKLYDIAK
jgi:hypothetical protein